MSPDIQSQGISGPTKKALYPPKKFSKKSFLIYQGTTSLGFTVNISVHNKAAQFCRHVQRCREGKKFVGKEKSTSDSLIRAIRCIRSRKVTLLLLCAYYYYYVAIHSSRNDNATLFLLRRLKICYFRKGLKEQKRMVKMLNDMFESTAYFDAEELTAVLLVSLSKC